MLTLSSIQLQWDFLVTHTSRWSTFDICQKNETFFFFNKLKTNSGWKQKSFYLILINSYLGIYTTNSFANLLIAWRCYCKGWDISIKILYYVSVVNCSIHSAACSNRNVKFLLWFTRCYQDLISAWTLKWRWIGNIIFKCILMYHKWP